MWIIRSLRHCLAIAIFVFALPQAVHAEATKGVVVFDKGCGSRFIVQTRNGYVLAEWYGGSIPAKGDMLVGEIDGYGFKEIYNLTADQPSRIYIDDYMLSAKRVMEKLRNKCG